MKDKLNLRIQQESIMGKALGVELIGAPITHEFPIESEDLVQEFVVQVSPSKAWAIVKSILFQLEHDADFIEIAIVSKREDVTR